MFPRFEVTEERSEPRAVFGCVSTTAYGRETWIGDGWIGYLMHGVTLIRGRWHRRGELWAFAPDSPGVTDAIRDQRGWSVLDSYWGERAELVLDRYREWHRARFEPTDAIQFKGTGGVWLRQATGSAADGGEVVEGAWDHEHCEICWETLCPGGQAEGYVSPSHTWVCERCYSDFIARASLDFIQNV